MDTQQASTSAQDTTYGHGVNSTVLQNLAILGKVCITQGRTALQKQQVPQKKGRSKLL